jgi:uncharacterized protein (TIGR02646 family)
MYIDKASQGEPASLQKFIRAQKEAGIHPSYVDFYQEIKKDLRQAIVKAQGWLCCYCMNRITAANSTIEHFLPQSKFKDEEVRYSNLFLACRYSRGKQKKEQHCDDKKGNELIPKYISDVDCGKYFAYSLSGEILPHGSYKSIRSCVRHFSNLTSTQQAVLATINILNLNASSLVAQRKSFIQELIKQINSLAADSIEKMIIKYQEREAEKIKRFYGVALYFLKDYLRRKFPNPSGS